MNFSQSCYTVIENFLTDEELELFLNDYKNATLSNNQNYQISCASEKLIKQLKPKIMEVCKSSGLDVDTLTPGAIYTDTSWIDWQWHQDHESFYTLQQHRNYLNFYILLSKDDPYKSGLSIIPMDRLTELVPDYIDKIINNGATAFFPKEDHTLVRSDDTGDTFVLPINIETIAVNPVVRAKDLLLLRGDVIHKTQDNTTARTAVSIRCTQGSAVISKERLLAGCEVKQTMIKNNQATYDSILKLFETKDIVTGKDLFGDFNEN